MNHHVLFVDDENEILSTLRRTFKNDVFKTSFANSGLCGLEILREKSADVIVADMRMPEMDGVEFLRQAKEICPDAISIVLSGYADLEMIMNVINEHSIWRYITKPWKYEDLRLIIRDALVLSERTQEKKELLTSLSIKNNELQEALQKEQELLHKLAETNSHLEILVEQRTFELRDAMHRLTIHDKTKNDFLSVLSHEFRTPLNGLLGVTDLILETCTETSEVDQFREMYTTSRERILNLLKNGLLLAEIDVGGDKISKNEINLNDVLSVAILQVEDYSKIRCVKFVNDCIDMGNVKGDLQLLTKAFHSLLRIAINLCPSGESVILNSQKTQTGIEFQATAPGVKLSKSSIDNFFDALAVNEIITPGGDWGLDPALAHHIVFLFNGSMNISNIDPSGVCIAVVFVVEK